jgi:hypothetical protein
VTGNALFSSGALFLAACAAAGTGPGGDEESSRLNRAPLIQTERSTYTAERGETRNPDGTLSGRYVRVVIRLRYTNSTDGPIYLPTCRVINPPLMEKKEGRRWVIAFAPIVQACLGPPQVIEPGKTFEYEYQVEGYEPGSRVMPQFNTAVPGTYRLVWDAYETWNGNGPEPGLGRQLPLPDRISNQFELTE